MFVQNFQREDSRKREEYLTCLRSSESALIPKKPASQTGGK